MTTLLLLLLAQDFYPLAEGHAWTYRIDGGPQELVRRVTAREKVGEED
jgi:hypothetical protein